MARFKRIQIPGLIRHVMARGNGRMRIFLDDTDYRHFVYVLGDVVEEFEIECWNYCAMPNHYHVTLQPTRANLSEAIRRLNGIYAQWWNRRHRRIGHVFQGRFKDQIVQHEEYLQTLSRYVVMNPVRARLVENPQDWPWSSYAATAGFSPPPAFLAVNSTLRLFGEGEPAALQARFAEYVLGQQDEECRFDSIRSSERTLGNRAFKVAVRASASWGAEEGQKTAVGLEATAESQWLET
jgi:putative transposase